MYYEDLKNYELDDSYGTWYDKDKKPITSDLMIIKLDTNAVIANIATINGLSDIKHDEYGDNPLAPTIEIYDTIYKELKDEEIIAIQWNVDEHFTLLMTESQRETLVNLIARARALGMNTAADGAQAVLDTANVSYTDAQAAIDTLAPTVVTKEKEEAEKLNDYSCSHNK